MKRKLITIGVSIILQIFFVFGQLTTTDPAIDNSTPSPLTSSDPAIDSSTPSPLTPSDPAIDNSTPSPLAPTDLSNLTSTSSSSSPSTSSVPETTIDPSANSATFDPVIYPYKTVKVPPNNGTWQICAQENTSYVSYSVRTVGDSFPLTPDYGTTNDSQLDPNPTAPKAGVVARIVYSDGLEFIPSLSCYSEIVMECDQDAGTILMKDSDKYCLQIINPGQVAQKVNVTVNFTSTVFQDGFTSDNKPGGNNKPLSGGSNSSTEYKSTFGILMILMMSLWLVI